MQLSPCWIQCVALGSVLLVGGRRQDEPFAVDLAARSISVRVEGGFVPLLGVEPILGAQDGPVAAEAVLEFLASVAGDVPLRIAEDPEAEGARAVLAFLPDDTLINRTLLEAGMARADTTRRHRLREDFVEAETHARSQGAGLWGYFAPREAAAPGDDGEGHHVYRIFYATDRAATGSTEPDERFGPERGDALVYGTCDVSIPRDHRMGELERPSIWRLEFREDPDEHVVLLEVEPLAAEPYFAALSDAVGRSRERAALVFVHGYNVEFAEAARRTAQLAYDLSFDGAPILYSWPSRGALRNYLADAATADWSAEHLRVFLKDLSRRSGARTVHLIAHSMGNRVLTHALRALAQEPPSDPPVRFNQVVLTAPDIDAQTFREQLAPAIRGTAERITLYASSEDEALELSKRMHHFPRAGDAGSGIVVVAGIDTIDVSAVDSSFLGHSYFGDNRSVISDLFLLLRTRKPPADRGLFPLPAQAPTHWEMRR